MKKTIIKILSMIVVFFVGIIGTSHYYNEGNLDMTAHMTEATLPILYFVHEGEYVNPSYGYVDEIDASCVRGAIMPLDKERELFFTFEKYNADIQSVNFEVRSSDMERLIQNGTVEGLKSSGGYLEGTLKVKDLLENSEEYVLILHVELENYEDVQYVVRIANSSHELVQACTDFAKEFHNATLDSQNTYPLTQYLETDQTKNQNSLASVDIHSKYKAVIWDGMEVEESMAPTITYLELEEDVVSLNMDYQVTYENEAGEKELYQVKDYYRVRQANKRMYLLDYERKAERIFSNKNKVFEKNSLNLGIQWETLPHMSNDEGSVVNFVVSDELWSFDIAQNKLSKVFSFKKGNDQRGLHDDFEIRMVNMEDSGSMDFIVVGYMNRGRHEGQNGVAVMRYDSLTNTTEELLFIKSNQCAGVLSKTVGELLYISYDDRMYLSYGGDIYAVDLRTKSVETLTEDLAKGDYLISRDGDMIAWQYGEDQYSSGKITTMDMKTGVRQIYTAGEGEYLRALAFSGGDFVYGVCKDSDVVEDFAGNTMFPMYCVKIVNSKGESIRDFDYLSKNKYVISASSVSNRINLDCVKKNGDGTYTETLAEAITSNEEELVKSISLSEQKDPVKKLEYVFRFTTEVEGKRKEVTPKQVVFEDHRTIALQTGDVEKNFCSYGKGEVTGLYPEIRSAIIKAYADMGVVIDVEGQMVWERGGRKTQSVLDLANGTEPMEAADSLEAALRILLEKEGIYVDVRSLLDQGKSPYEILKENSLKVPENFTGCNLSSVLFYVSRGQAVLAMTEANRGELIVGYDAQNIYVLNPLSGQVTKMGQKDAAAYYEASGNVFFSFLK